jgi:diguanylate cyclase (GGDEF)-like protein
MRQLVSAFSSIEQLAAFFSADETRHAIDNARSVLAQVFIARHDPQFMSQLLGELTKLPEKVLVVGATTFGQICEGKATSGSNSVCLGCFDTASLVQFHLESGHGQEVSTATALADALATLSEPLKGLLLVTNPVSFNCDTLLAALYQAAPGIALFGGGAGNFDFAHTIAFSRQGYSETAVIAVALCGGTLEIMRRAYLGWVPVGKRMRVTRTNGFYVETIDDQPAFEVYQRYLGINSTERFWFHAMEFPMLVSRFGQTMASVPTDVGDNKTILMSLKLEEGEQIQFGYADLPTVAEHVKNTEAAFREFGPEAISIFSCMIRYFVLQKEVGSELTPFQQIASTAGFFTLGEFYDAGTHSALLNASFLAVAMREGVVHATPPPPPGNAGKLPELDLFTDSHTRILLRLQHFMRATTEDLAAVNRELANLAEHDSLTGLLNRRAFGAHLESESERSLRYDSQFSIILCDADHFKNINDIHGHQAGDFVLQTLASNIEKELRATDSACRYGGEEFAILLPETGPDTALRLAERIRANIEALSPRHDGRPLSKVTMSFGIASFPEHARSAQELVKAADNALYAAKRHGRNRVHMAGYAPPVSV